MAPPARAHLDVNGRRRRRAEIDAINNAELRANAQDVISSINGAMPKNTWRNYDPKQREFKVRTERARRARRARGSWLTTLLPSYPYTKD